MYSSAAASLMVVTRLECWLTEYVCCDVGRLQHTKTEYLTLWDSVKNVKTV